MAYLTLSQSSRKPRPFPTNTNMHLNEWPSSQLPEKPFFSDIPVQATFGMAARTLRRWGPRLVAKSGSYVLVTSLSYPPLSPLGGPIPRSPNPPLSLSVGGPSRLLRLRHPLSNLSFLYPPPPFRFSSTCYSPPFDSRSPIQSSGVPQESFTKAGRTFSAVRNGVSISC